MLEHIAEEMLAELATPLQHAAGAPAAAAVPGKEPDASARPPSCPITRGELFP